MLEDGDFMVLTRLGFHTLRKKRWMDPSALRAVTLPVTVHALVPKLSTEVKVTSLGKAECEKVSAMACLL